MLRFCTFFITYQLHFGGHPCKIQWQPLRACLFLNLTREWPRFITHINCLRNIQWTHDYMLENLKWKNENLNGFSRMDLKNYAIHISVPNPCRLTFINVIAHYKVVFLKLGSNSNCSYIMVATTQYLSNLPARSPNFRRFVYISSVNTIRRRTFTHQDDAT